MLRNSFLRQLSAISIGFLLTGCLSITDVLTTETILSKQSIYNQNRLAWQNAATRKNDLFSQYRLHVFASVKWEKRSDASTYQLNDFSISPAAVINDQFKLDLISPDFNKKMACGWYCEYLDQPIMQKVLGPYTMLDKTFESQKVDLLNFYQSLERLNQHLNTLDPALQALLPDIFANLTQTERTFDSLSNIIGFLNDYFDNIDFETFLAKQKSQTSENSSSILTLINNDLAIIAPQNASLNPEAKLLASFSPELTLSQMLKFGSAAKQKTVFFDYSASKENLSALTNNMPNNEDDMIEYKTQKTTSALYSGQFVCSFKGNYFGVVTDVKNGIVSLKLNGQAKKLNDGLLEEAQDGLLFLTDTEFSYFSLDSDKEFSQDQLKPCYLSGFS